MATPVVIVSAQVRNHMIVSVKPFLSTLMFWRHLLPTVFHMLILKSCTVTRSIIPNLEVSSTVHIQTTKVNHGLIMFL